MSPHYVRTRASEYHPQKRDTLPPLTIPFQQHQQQQQQQADAHRDLEQLVTVLQYAMSHDPQRQKPAEQMLLDMEKRMGFVMLLFLVLNNGEMAMDVRNLASICLKNSIIRYWRKDADFALTTEEREFLVDRMVAFSINESHAQIRAQLALALAKMARHAFPKQPDLIVSQLIEPVRGGSSNALSILSQVVKALAAMQIVSAKKNFARLSETLLPMLCQLWSRHIQTVMDALQTHGGQQNPEQVVAHAHDSVTCSKILRRIIVSGFKDISDKQDVILLLQLLHKGLTMMIQFRSECQRHNIRNAVLISIERCIVFFMKIPVMVQLYHPIPFRSVLLPYLQFCTQQVAQSDPQSELTLELLIIRCLVFLKNVAECSSYERPDETSDKRLEAYNIVHKEFFTLDTLVSLNKILISRFMLLSDNELEQWQDEPEEFVKDQELDWTDTIKSAADNLYLVLLETFQETLAPVIVQLAQQTFQETNGSFEKDKLILREACYSAVGWGSYHLYEKINFVEWFNSVLKREIEMQDPRYIIIRRRAAWLTGRWIEQIDEATRCSVYESLIVLANDADAVLKLTALCTLDEIVKDYDFSAEKFEPYMDRIMQSIFATLPQLKEEDSKLRIVNLLSCITEKMESKILPYVEIMARVISALWSEMDCTALLRNALLGICKKLTGTLEDQSEKIRTLILPLLMHSTDPEKEDFLYLGDDALELYRLTIQFSGLYTEDLMHLYGNIIKIMQGGFEHLYLCLNITEGYILLGKFQFLNRYAPAIAETFTEIIGNVKDKGTFGTANILDTLLTLFPEESPKAFAQPLFKILTELLLPEPESSLSTLISTTYMCLFARILYHSRDVFTAMFHQFYQQHQQHYDRKTNKGSMSVVLEFLDRWINESDHIISSFKRKVSALAMLNFYPSTEPELLRRFPLVFNICVQVLYEMDESYLEVGSKIVKLNNLGDDMHEPMQGRTEFDRKRVLMENDPAIKVDMYDAMVSKVNELKTLLDDMTFKQLMQSVDPAIARQFDQYPQHKEKRKEQSNRATNHNGAGRKRSSRRRR